MTVAIAANIDLKKMLLKIVITKCIAHWTQIFFDIDKYIDDFSFRDMGNSSCVQMLRFFF